MDFFTELLESFSRKHNRKLKLLEQEVDPRVKQASDMVLAALSSPQAVQRGRSIEVPINTTSGEKTLSQFGSKLALAGRNVGWDGQSITLGGGKNPEKTFKEFITILVGEELSQEDAEKKDTLQQQTQMSDEQLEAIFREQRRSKILNSGMAQDNFEKVSEIIQNVESFEQSLNSLLCTENNRVNPEYYRQVADSLTTSKQADYWDYCQNHTQFLTGDRVGNVERQLVSDTPTLDYNGETKQWEVGAAEQDPTISTEISKLLNTLVKAAQGDETAQEEACKKFKVTKGGGLNGVVVFTELGADDKGMSGRVFNNEGSSRALRGLMGMAGCDLTPQSATKIASRSVGNDSSIRGELGEISKIAVTDILNVVRGRAEGEDSPEFIERQKLAEESIQAVRNQLKQLNIATEAWVERAQGAVVTPEEQAFIEQVSDMDSKKFLRAIFSMAATTARLRQPLVSVQVAEQVTKGEKQDVLECWGSLEKAERALRKSEEYVIDGETQSRVSSDSIAEVSVEEVFKNKPDLLKRYIKAGILKKGQTLYVSEISLKTQLSLGRAKQGETTPNSVRESISGEIQDARADNFFSKLRKAKNPKIGPKVRDVQGQADKISESIDKLKFKVTVVRQDGKGISKNSMRDYAQAVVDNFRKNKTFKDLNDDDFISLQNYVNDLNVDKLDTDKKLENKIREKLFRMTLNNSISNTAKKKTKNGKPTADAQAAMLYGLAVFNQAGGSARDSTLFQVDTLDTLTSYISTQNGEMNSVLNSILENDGKWEFISEGSFTFRRVGNINRSLSVSLKDGKWIASRSATSIRDASTAKKSRDISEEEVSDSLILQALGKLHEALGVIKEKMRVLDTQ